MKIPLVADLSKSISRDYGVLKEDEGIAYRSVRSLWGCWSLSIDWIWFLYLIYFGGALRGLFVIDDKGILRQITINDLPVGRSVDETLRLVQAFQHTDKYGEGERLNFTHETQLLCFVNISTAEHRL